MCARIEHGTVVVISGVNGRSTEAVSTALCNGEIHGELPPYKKGDTNPVRVALVKVEPIGGEMVTKVEKQLTLSFIGGVWQ